MQSFTRIPLKHVVFVFILGLICSITTSYVGASSHVTHTDWVVDEYYFPAPLPDCDFPNKSDGWVMTGGGQFFHWNGKDWRMYEVGAGFYHQLEFANPEWGWAVGPFQSLAHWNGEKWEAKELSSRFNFEFNLNDIYLMDEGHGWIVGEFDDQTENASVVSDIRFQWDGSEWIEFPEIYGDFLGSDAVIAFPESGLWTAEPNELNFFAGLNWEDGSEPKSYAIDLFSATSFSGLSGDEFWVSGYNENLGRPTGLIFHWDGTKWKKELETDTYISSVEIIEKNFGIAVGYTNFYNTTGMIASPDLPEVEGVIYEWDGTSWSLVRSEDSYAFLSVCALHDEFWVVGRDQQGQGVAFRFSKAGPTSATNTPSILTTTPHATLLSASEEIHQTNTLAAIKTETPIPSSGWPAGASIKNITMVGSVILLVISGWLLMKKARSKK